MSRKLIVVLLVAQLLLAGSFVGAQLLERQQGGGFTLFGGAGMNTGSASSMASNAMGSSSMGSSMAASNSMGGALDTASALINGATNTASQGGQMAGQMIGSMGSSMSGGMSGGMSSMGGMGGGMLQSMTSLISGLGQDEREMMQREINVAVRILNLANDRLAATNSMADLNRENMMQFAQDATSLVGESTRSLGQPVGSMFNRIMGVGR